MLSLNLHKRQHLIFLISTYSGVLVWLGTDSGGFRSILDMSIYFSKVWLILFFPYPLLKQNKPPDSYVQECEAQQVYGSKHCFQSGDVRICLINFLITKNCPAAFTINTF